MKDLPYFFSVLPLSKSSDIDVGDGAQIGASKGKESLFMEQQQYRHMDKEGAQLIKLFEGSSLQEREAYYTLRAITHGKCWNFLGICIHELKKFSLKKFKTVNT